MYTNKAALTPPDPMWPSPSILLFSRWRVLTFGMLLYRPLHLRHFLGKYMDSGTVYHRHLYAVTAAQMHSNFACRCVASGKF